MDEGLKFGVMVLIGAAFIAALFAFFGMTVLAGASESPSIWLLVSAIPLAGITIFMAFFLSRKRKSVKSGIPLDDEMSQRIKERAGYIAYLTVSWTLIGLMFYMFISEDYGFPELPARYIIYIALLALFGSYFVTWALAARKGLK